MAVAIAYGHDLVTLQLLVAAKADVVAALFGGGGRTVAVNHRHVKTAVLRQLEH